MAINTEEFIGKHFKLKHLIYSNIALNNKINNMPGVDVSPTQSTIINNLKNLMINVIDYIVDDYPNLIITSLLKAITTELTSRILLLLCLVMLL